MATEFLLFARLPPELRHMIWKFTLPGPRIHKAVQKHLHDCPEFEAHIISPRLPVALSICHESREVARQVLTLFRRCHCPEIPPCNACGWCGKNSYRYPNSYRCQGYGKIGYFNREIDTLHLDIWDSDKWDSFQRGDAPWADFTRISVATNDVEDYYEELSTLLESRPSVSQIYLTILRVDERMKEIVPRKRILTMEDLDAFYNFSYDKLDDLHDLGILLDTTQCVSLESLEIVTSEKDISGELKHLEQFRAHERMAAKLVDNFGKGRNLAVDVAMATILCSCP